MNDVAVEADHRARALSQITTRSVDEVLEQAAQVAEKVLQAQGDGELYPDDSGGWEAAADDVIAAIRALKSRPVHGGADPQENQPVGQGDWECFHCGGPADRCRGIDCDKPVPAPAQDEAVQPILTYAARDVLAERRRQVEEEGWTPEHDDAWQDGSIALAAAAYALSSAGFAPLGNDIWPWDRKWWKPTDPRRDLVKAGELILAEIERRDRIEAERLVKKALEGRT